MKKVLIVDDETAITDGLKALLELSEIDAAGAYDRENAERLLASEFYPVVIADLRLHTEEEGLKLLEAIRRISPRSRVATLTAYATPNAEARLRALGSTVILRKPLPFEEILATIQQMLDTIEQQVPSHLDATGALDLDALYEDVRRVLFAIPQRKFGLTPEETEDLVQETWLLFLQKRHEIVTSKSWLTGTVVNLCKQRIQRNTRKRSLMREIVDEDQETLQGRPGVSIETFAVQQALGQLDERARRLCILIGLEGRPYDEVAEELGLPIGSVGPLYIRAKAKLQKLMTPVN